VRGLEVKKGMKKIALALLAVLIVAFFVPLASALNYNSASNTLSWVGWGGAISFTASVKEGTDTRVIPITVLLIRDDLMAENWMYVWVDGAWAKGQMSVTQWSFNALLYFDYGNGQKEWHTVSVDWKPIGNFATAGFQFLRTEYGLMINLYGVCFLDMATITIDGGSHAMRLMSDEALWMGGYIEVTLP